MSKTELIVSEETKNSVTTTEATIKFESRITTSDLIESVIFDKEEELQKTKEELYKVYNELIKVSDISLERQKRSLRDYQSKYKNNDIEKLIKHMKKAFPDKSFNPEPRYGFSIQGDKLTVSIEVRVAHYNFLTKQIEVVIPNTIKKVLNTHKKDIKNKDNAWQEIAKIENKIRQLPTLKKRIKSTFVKGYFNSGIKDKRELLLKLKEDLANVIND